MSPLVLEHLLQATAFRSENAHPSLRTFVFEKLPFKVRRRIFRELLLKPREFDVENPGYDDECAALNALVEDLMIYIGKGTYHMHPTIMRTNKKMHKEAAAVLYGENWYAWSIRTRCPRYYMSLITKMRLVIEIMDFPLSHNRFRFISLSVRHLCDALSWNDFKVLVVDYEDHHDHDMRQKGRASCLEHLQHCRAQTVSIKNAREFSTV